MGVQLVLQKAVLLALMWIKAPADRHTRGFKSLLRVTVLYRGSFLPPISKLKEYGFVGDGDLYFYNFIFIILPFPVS